MGFQGFSIIRKINCCLFIRLVYEIQVHIQVYIRNMYIEEVYRNVIRVMKKINRTKNRRNVEYFLASLKT